MLTSSRLCSLLAELPHISERKARQKHNDVGLSNGNTKNQKVMGTKNTLQRNYSHLKFHVWSNYQASLWKTWNALKFTFKDTTQMSFIQKLLWINNTEWGKPIHGLGRQEIQHGGRRKSTQEAVGSDWKTNDGKTWTIWSAWLCWEQSTDCEGNRRVSGGGNQQKKSSEDMWRANCCSAVRRSHTLQTRNQSIKEDVGSRK